MINILTAAMIAAANLTSNSVYGWVCSTLDSNPTEDGVWTVVVKSYKTGDSPDVAADKIVAEVKSGCPEYIPLLKSWARHNG